MDSFKNIDRIIALISSIGTFISAIVVIFTLREMKEQRKSAYRPELIVNNSNFFIYSDTNGRRYFPAIWSNKELEKPSKENIEKIKPIHLNVYNIGLAAAKCIEIRWSFDVAKIIDEINSFKDFDDVEVTYNRNIRNRETVEIICPSGEIFLVLNNDFFKISYDYLLPNDKDGALIEVEIPYVYCMLCSTIIYYKMINGKNSDIDFDKFPEFSLSIKYEDISRNVYEKEFKFKLNINSMIVPLKNNENNSIVKIVHGNILKK